MEPKKPRSKTLVFVLVLAAILCGLAFYYFVAIRTSDNQPVGTMNVPALS